MTTPLLKVQVLRKPVIKGKVDVRFPARVDGGTGLKITKANGVYTFDLDFLELAPVANIDPSAQYVAIVDGSGFYQRISLADFINNPTTTIQTVTAAGDVTVGANVQLLIMNRTADESPSNITLPTSSAKVGKIKIVDFKGNAGTYPHTIKLQGSDEFQGSLTEWTLGGDGASVVFDPIPGTGYAA